MTGKIKVEKEKIMTEVFIIIYLFILYFLQTSAHSGFYQALQVCDTLHFCKVSFLSF